MTQEEKESEELMERLLQAYGYELSDIEDE